MLNMKQADNITGTSTIDGKIMQRYTASIDHDNPENLNISEVIVDKDGYRDNREECHKDMAEFEDAVYAIQAELMGEDAKHEDD